MKKSYIAPQTEAIEVIANGVLMVSSGGYIDPLGGVGGSGGSGSMM
jgi:hypothetical protein